MYECLADQLVLYDLFSENDTYRRFICENIRILYFLLTIYLLATGLRFHNIILTTLRSYLIDHS